MITLIVQSFLTSFNEDNINHTDNKYTKSRTRALKTWSFYCNALNDGFPFFLTLFSQAKKKKERKKHHFPKSKKEKKKTVIQIAI